jgi:hypothetical protein
LTVTVWIETMEISLRGSFCLLYALGQAKRTFSLTTVLRFFELRSVKQETVVPPRLHLVRPHKHFDRIRRSAG